MPKRIVVNLSDADIVALEHDLSDVDQWVQDAVAGKIASCRKRLAEEAQRFFLADAETKTMPAKAEELLAEYLKRPGYMNRKARDELERQRDEEAQAALPLKDGGDEP